MELMDYFRNHLPCPICGNDDITWCDLIFKVGWTPQVFCLKCRTNLTEEQYG